MVHYRLVWVLGTTQSALVTLNFLAKASQGSTWQHRIKTWVHPIMATASKLQEGVSHLKLSISARDKTKKTFILENLYYGIYTRYSINYLSGIYQQTHCNLKHDTSFYDICQMVSVTVSHACIHFKKTYLLF